MTLAQLVQHIHYEALKALVHEPGPISGDRVLGVIRSRSLHHTDAPVDAISLRLFRESFPGFIQAVSVHPDHEAAPGITYRELRYFTIVGDIKYGRAPNRTFVRMDLTDVQDPV